MTLRNARSRWIETAEIGTAGLLIVSFLLPWFQGRGATAAESSSWIHLLLNSGWLTALEVDLVTFGAIVALIGALAGLLRLRRELALALAATAVGGFVASALGAIWTLAESGNAAFYWGSWGVTIDPGAGLWLSLAAAVVGAVAGVVGFILPASRASDSRSLESSKGPVAAGALPPVLRYGDVRHAPASRIGAGGGTAGRISVVESGRESSLSVGEGERVIVGRDLGADIRVSDAKVSRRHAMIEWSAGSWIVRDLPAANQTRLVDPSGAAQILTGQIRIASGQLVIGDVFITLHPPETDGAIRDRVFGLHERFPRSVG
jgi:hypothetical protein